MNFDNYKEQAKELAQRAKVLESTMMTYKALEYCTLNGHDFNMHLTPDNHIDGLCANCAIRITATDITLKFDEANTEGFGELAGKTIEEIPITPPPKTSETADKPTLPLEQTNQSDGTYRVDVSEILGQKGEE
tara:strand:- start:5492 stop:5890 length:399 start_codon:yes stop_codon:yes gene_type:complete